MTESTETFEQLGIGENLLKALKEVGYETPTQIQAGSIPPLLEGRDILGQAQTGTGKTAAFALPLLQKIDLTTPVPQVLVLAPTRELAIQVAEAFQRYAQHLKGFHILPIYGGQGYERQISALKRGVHVVVGTPGRVMDHMRRGTLKLGGLKHLVLDEADEMLRMGFIDDVEWILAQTPPERQIALFSATMPRQIAKVAKTYLRDPVHIATKVATVTAETIRQRYWPVSGLHKLDALTRILEAEPFDAMIIFVRTKTATVELTEKLQARGYRADALNGDITQALRERSIEKLKNGQTDILVATDVAARGLDVERISHVLNYDIPYDSEAYIHRIGRTGRAGRTGEAILFVARREMRMLHAIEKATRKRIEPMTLPSATAINDQRVQRFKQKITDALADEDLSFFRGLMEDYQRETDYEALDIAAALAHMAQGDKPFLLKDAPKPSPERDRFRDKSDQRDKGSPREHRNIPRVTYRIEVGHVHGVSPGQIVGAIANEAGLEGKHIGHIKIHDDYSTVDLPAGMPEEIFEDLQHTRVCQQALKISPIGRSEGRKPAPSRRPRTKPKPGAVKKSSAPRAGSKKPSANKKPPRKKSADKKAR